MKILVSVWTWCAWIASAGLLWPTPGQAAEPATQFLEALRAQGYHDTALEYLEQIKDRSDLSAEWRESYDYQRGLVLIDAVRNQRDLGLREKQLDDAQNSLKQFVAQHPQHDKALSANTLLANLLAERAKLRLEQASGRENNEQLLKQARDLFDEAIAIFGKLEPDIQQKLDAIPRFVDDQDPMKNQLGAQREQLRADLVQMRLLAANAREDAADTFPPGTPEATKYLTDAMGLYNDIYEKNRRYLPGQYARFFQGRTAYKLGKTREAIGYFSELLDQPDSPAPLRVLKTKTVPLVMDAYLHETEKKYADAIRVGQDWLSKARGNEDRQPDWLAIRYLVAQSHRLYAKQLEGANPKDRQIKPLLEEARRLAQLVARVPNPRQREAEQLLTELGVSTEAGERPRPTTFAAARQAGEEALQNMQSAALLATQLPARLAQEKDAAMIAEVKQQLAKAEQDVVGNRSEALEMFRRAVLLVERETPIEDVNMVRYYLAYLYYSQDDLHDAAILGEFLARRFPDSARARHGAQIALASNVRLYGAAEADQRQFETTRVMELADYIIGKWSGLPEAEDALNTLIPFLANAGQFEQAITYLERIPADSPKRGDAELRTGQAMWEAYRRGLRELRQWERDGAPAGTDVAARQAELESIKERSQQVLAAGVDHLQKAGQAGAAAAPAVLALAQVYLDVGQGEQAVTLLEDPKIGPLALVEAGHEVAQRPGFADETYKTALRAYITSSSSGANPEAAIAKARQVMTAMKDAAGGTPEGKKQLVSIYVTLAQDLEKQLALAPPDARKALSSGFETFLSQIREESTEFDVLNWVAGTYQGMANELGIAGSLSPESKKYLEQARTTYERILETVQLEPAYQTHIRLQMANVQREMGQFKEALDVYENLLRDQNLRVDVQVEAARTLQQWGGSKGNELYYDKAIQGDRPLDKTRKNILWGWAKISQMTAHKEKFESVFFEARYNLAWCRYQLALARTKPDERQRLLDVAEQEIALTAKLFRELGGPQWRAKFDALMKEIQKANGKAASGIPTPQELSKTG